MRHTLDYILRKILGIKPAISIYARPGGSHAHTDLNCLMLRGDQFKELGYKEISIVEAKRKSLNPCACMERRLKV